MKRAMRCHDFGSGREASRSQYREYWQGERQSHGPKFVPAPWITVGYSDACAGVAARIGADFVGRLGHIRDMPCAVLRAITDSGSQRTRVSLC
jgi:hypothetical protein